MPPPTIDRLGAYEILFALKSGGMGDVLLARRRGPGGFEQLVAVKTIRAELAAMPSVRTMFLDEARLLARLTHPAIATVHDFGEHAGVLFLAMEYVAGIRIRELGLMRPPPAIAARAIAQACRGLHAAHELRDLTGTPLGVVHRDISPENLMLGFDGQVKVLDFGIALVRGRMTITEHGTVKGKPPYMSPEQVRGEAIDRRSDVFSVALVLHEILTGTPVFDGDSIYAVARAIADAPIAPPSAKAGALPAGLDDAVMRALSRDPAVRTPSAAAFADDLERVAAAEGGVSLAAWTDGALAEDREEHRTWLADLVGGRDAVRGTGRRSGVMTARGAAPKAAEHDAGMVAFAKLAAAADADAAASGASPRVIAVVDVAAVAEVAEPEEESGTGKGSDARLALVALLLLLLGGGVVLLVVMSMRGKRDAVASTSDARTVAPAAPDARVTVPVAVDAAIADAPVRDTPIDAGRTRRDAGPRAVPVDAAARAVPIDAAPVAPDAAVAAAKPGKGWITITAEPFALIKIDGKDFGTTPIYRRKLPAGEHTVELRSPDSGEVRLRKKVDIVAGELETIEL